MNTYVIKEFGDFVVPEASYIDLAQSEVKNCVGCWTCWWKTPGKCIFQDLESFYRSYIHADKVILFVKPQCGFVSSRIKTLFDRMLPLFLPYTYCEKGCTWHTPRYPKYPDIEIYYESDFKDETEHKLFHEYLYRVFEQFHSKNIQINPVSKFVEGSR